MQTLKTLTLISTFTLIFGSTAFGQDNGAESTGQGVTAMDAITVTASKREGTLKEFPGNITVKDDLFLDTHGVQDVSDLSRFAPNIHFKQTTSGGAIISRGISTIDTSLFGPMGLYVDDVAYPLNYMVNQRIFDAQRVEILRGPQATLYGRNSESGIVNIVLKPPDDDARYRIFAEGGSFSTARLGGSASGPIIAHELFYGFCFQGYRTNGYNCNKFKDDDDVSGERSYAGRGTLRWVPAGDWDLSLTVDGTQRDLGISTLRYDEGPYKTDRHNVSVDGMDEADEEAFGQAVKIKHKWPAVALNSITSHRYFNRDHDFDADRTSASLSNSILGLQLDSWAQEIRLSSPKNAANTWLVGFYGRYEEIEAGLDFKHNNPAMAKKRDGNSEDRGFAAFSQVTYEIRAGLKITGGLRLDISRNSGEQVYTSDAGTLAYEADLDETEWLPMGALAYDVTPHLNVYASFAQGFLAGGFNFWSATSKETFTYTAEHSTNYEIGMKTNWLKDRLLASLAVFHTEISDKQVREESDGGPNNWKFTNAAEARTRGVDMEITFHPVPVIELFGGIGYSDTEVNEWITMVDGTWKDYSGNRLPWAPEFTYNFGVGYYHANGFFSLVDLFGAGSQYFDAANTIKDDGYRLVNIRIGFQPDEFEVSLWCNNLFDEAYATRKVRNNSGFVMVEDGAPRTYGINFNWRF